MSNEDLKGISSQLIDNVFTKGDFKNVERFLSPNFKYHARGEDIEGIEKFKEWISSDRDIFSDIRYSVADSIAEGGKVVTIWFVEGTHDKEFRGIPATHKKFETIGVTIFHFDGNKIREAWTIVDGLTPALELGIVKTLVPESNAA